MILTPEDPCQLEFGCRADLVAAEPLVEAVERLVERLKLSVLYSRYSEAGRSFFDPAMQLKVLFFAYCDGVRSCRAIAKHICYDIRYRYFCGSLRPDFRTINRFRHDNLDLLSGYFAELVLFFEEWGLLELSQLALDSSKFRALSSARKRSRSKKLDQLSRQFREQLASDAAADGEKLEQSEGDKDAGPSLGSGAKVDYEEFSDPDARFMKTSEGGKRLSYNAHVVVDKNQVIVAADVSNNADDSVHFAAMLRQTKTILGRKPQKLLADGGYYSGRNISRGHREGLDLYLPVSRSGGKVADGFHRDAFSYDAASDSYRCPQGATLPYQSTRYRRGTATRVYRGRAVHCGACPCRHLCTAGRVRTLEITEHYRYERQMRVKLASAAGKQIYQQRQGQVEPVFGNLKFNLGFRRFQLRRLAKVQGEFLLFCIAHNLRKLAARLAFYCLQPSVRLLLRLCHARSESIWAQLVSKWWSPRSKLPVAA